MLLTDTLTRLTTLSGSALFPPVVVRLSPPDKWLEFLTFHSFSSLSTHFGNISSFFMCSVFTQFLVGYTMKHLILFQTVIILICMISQLATGVIYLYLYSSFVCLRFLSSKLLLNLEINVSFTLSLELFSQDQKNIIEWENLAENIVPKLIPFWNPFILEQS